MNGEEVPVLFKLVPASNVVSTPAGRSASVIVVYSKSPSSFALRN